MTGRARVLVRGLVIVAAVFGSIVAGHALWEAFGAPPRIVTVDLQHLIRAFVAKTAKSDLSDEEKRARTAAFAGELDRVMAELAARQHVVILPRRAVVAGAPDITEAIEKGLRP